MEPNRLAKLPPAPSISLQRSENCQPPARKRPRRSKSKTFACPIFQYDKAMRWDSLCGGVGGGSMSDVRRHLERSPHKIYIRLCKTCNEDIIDQSEYNNLHGGKCRTVGGQRRGGQAEEQWNRLFKKLKPTASFQPSPYNNDDSGGESDSRVAPSRSSTPETQSLFITASNSNDPWRPSEGSAIAWDAEEPQPEAMESTRRGSEFSSVGRN
ncbi:hypothetical protein K491DRAFT_239579 [Lophiostoma macrostomum CBS 122681]|uniref:Uncharacterized protein n=1 Tax=Lophiostoma macrostomum CBS 122681 TaxID=1314788 RepID=A0A6A6SPU3_9PLEO|nr:hypothetical protein K491DRAFT_239579 [Lophiostoma macrostomum CBS 122681]